MSYAFELNLNLQFSSEYSSANSRIDSRFDTVQAMVGIYISSRWQELYLLISLMIMVDTTNNLHFKLGQLDIISVFKEIINDNDN